MFEDVTPTSEISVPSTSAAATGSTWTSPSTASPVTLQATEAVFILADPGNASTFVEVDYMDQVLPQGPQELPSEENDVCTRDYYI